MPRALVIFTCKHCSKDFRWENTMHLHQAACPKKPKIVWDAMQFNAGLNFYETRRRRREPEPPPKPQPSVPQPEQPSVPQSSAPQPAPQSSVPQPSAPPPEAQPGPQPSAPQPSVPQPSVPQPKPAAQPSVPQPSVPQPSVPQPSVPQPSVPQPSAPQPSVPRPEQPSVPQPAPQLSVSQPSAPQPIPQPSVPQLPAPQPEQPSTTRTIGEADAIEAPKLRTYQSRPQKVKPVQKLAPPSRTYALAESAERSAVIIQKPKQAQLSKPKSTSTSKRKLDDLSNPIKVTAVAPSKKVLPATPVQETFDSGIHVKRNAQPKKSEAPKAKIPAKKIKAQPLKDPQAVPSYKCNYCSKTFAKNFERILHQQRGHYFTQMPLKSNLSTRRFGLQSRNETVFKKAESSESESESSSSESGSSSASSFETISLSLTDSSVLSDSNLGDQGQEEKGRQLFKKTEEKQSRIKTDAELLEYLSRVKIDGRTAYFVCSICDKKIKDIENSRTHVRSHFGEKPFQCSYCNSSFASKKEQAKHEKTVHCRNLKQN